MNIPRCPHLDHLARELVEAYRRAEERDLLGLLVGREIPNEIEAVHLAMAQHRRECPLCSKVDRGRPRERAMFNALKERPQTIP